MSGTAPDAGKALPPEIEQLARVPPLPIEAPLVQGVRALEALKGQADVLLLLLQHLPGDSAQISAALNILSDHGNAAINAITRFREIRECKGQG